MNKSELLFYDAYEAFYQMTNTSTAFQSFCKDAFGEDFSQDGFSDVHQIDLILPLIPRKGNVHILDVGCGNGKMLSYLQRKTGAYVHGFDYSEHAIAFAQSQYTTQAEFRHGIIGEIEYSEESFDLIISMDTMYFAPDMNTFVSQVKKWLKPDGIFFVGYQEGDVIPKTESIGTSLLAQALRKNDMPYHATDITAQTYTLLQRKRQAALHHQMLFEAEGNQDWFDMLIGQTDCILENYSSFALKMARYIFVANKE